MTIVVTTVVTIVMTIVRRFDRMNRFISCCTNRCMMMFLFGLSASLLGSGLVAQQVYRCQQADGSTTYSDLPCRTESGAADRVDATPHQGHREPGVSTTMRPARVKRQTGPALRADVDDAIGLPRHERLTLENRRAVLLSGLKRRHVDARERRALIKELREVDETLGIEPGDVADMPYHNREIYEDYRVFRR